MTKIYLVRHAKPDFKWSDDLTRPLTADGISDSHKVSEALAQIHLDYAISSPYFRSIKTIEECALSHNLSIDTDIRLRERKSGHGGNNMEMFRKRWTDFNYHEDGGESLISVQERNINALKYVLNNHKNESILIGTHGTALSTILNYYDNSFGCDDFLRIINFMPYIIRLDFEGYSCIRKEEVLIVEKKYD
ncbi:MAG: histidine phosphatase family protein [Ruminococcus sp.]|nr:histidine phosphatase family protein [Ruminococcus sp.]